MHGNKMHIYSVLNQGADWGADNKRLIVQFILVIIQWNKFFTLLYLHHYAIDRVIWLPALKHKRRDELRTNLMTKTFVRLILCYRINTVLVFDVRLVPAHISMA